LQQGIIFHAKVSGDPTLYHDLVSVRVRGRLDLDALRRVLDRLAARHEILRTSFDLGTHREVVQLVHGAGQIPLSVSPAGAPAGAPAGDAVRRWWRTVWHRGFALTRPPLVRCHVLDSGDDEFRLAVSAHHSILDGWSFARLVTELLAGYDDELAGRVRAAPGAGPVRYRDSSHWNAGMRDPRRRNGSGPIGWPGAWPPPSTSHPRHRRTTCRSIPTWCCRCRRNRSSGPTRWRRRPAAP
jgi:hypothetical protein